MNDNLTEQRLLLTPEKIPKNLSKLRFCMWNKEIIEGKYAKRINKVFYSILDKGKYTERLQSYSKYNIPYQLSLEEALNYANKYNCFGIGFCNSNNIVTIIVHHCIDAFGSYNVIAKHLMQRYKSYSEFIDDDSIQIIIEDKFSEIFGNDKLSGRRICGTLEIIWSDNFTAFTGKHLSETPTDILSYDNATQEIIENLTEPLMGKIETDPDKTIAMLKAKLNTRTQNQTSFDIIECMNDITKIDSEFNKFFDDDITGYDENDFLRKLALYTNGNIDKMLSLYQKTEFCSSKNEIEQYQIIKESLTNFDGIGYNSLHYKMLQMLEEKTSSPNDNYPERALILIKKHFKSYPQNFIYRKKDGKDFIAVSTKYLKSLLNNEGFAEKEILRAFDTNHIIEAHDENNSNGKINRRFDQNIKVNGKSTRMVLFNKNILEN